MIRMRTDLDLFTEQVKKDVLETATEDHRSLNIVNGQTGGQFHDRLVPFEVKITKAKEGQKDVMKYHLFSGINLRIYSFLEHFDGDIKAFKERSHKLNNNINTLGTNMVSPDMLSVQDQCINLL